MRVEHYAVHLDEDASPQQPVGLYRRTFDAEGRRTSSEAYHPRTGWSPTDYWRRVERGEPPFHLVEVDEVRARQLQEHFLAREAAQDT